MSGKSTSPEAPALGTDLEITAFWHCGLCLSELPEGTSPRDWARISVGWTKRGWQVWCVRHKANICNADLNGNKVTVNTNMSKREAAS